MMAGRVAGSRRRVSTLVVLALVAGGLALAPLSPAAAQVPPDEPEAPRPKGDVVFVVDESGSMGPDIADVKARIGDVVAQLGEAGVDYRIGVVGYSAGNRVYQPLTDDLALIQAGVNQLLPNKDNPEAGFSATVKAMSDELGHRDDAATCEVLISDENADVTAAYPETRLDAVAALRARDAAFFGVVLPSGNFDYGPQVGSLAEETEGATFDLLAFRQDAGPVLAGLMDSCITKITSETPLEVSAGDDQAVPEGSTVTLAGSATSGVKGIESRGRFAVSGKADLFAAGQSASVSPGGVLPVEVDEMVAGTSLTFSGASGTTRQSTTCGSTIYPPDGAGGNLNTTAIGGISGITAPDQQILSGVFVGDSAPSAPAPFELNYQSGRTEFEVVRPLIGQSFMVGDGLSPAGKRQRFVVPDGATRLFLGVASDDYTISCGGYEIDVESSTGPAPITYGWELVSSSGPPVQLSAANVATPTFPGFDDGTYLLRLTATDGVETLSDDVSVTVGNQVPVISQVASDAAATDGLVEVTVAYSDPGPFDAHEVVFDWGDGSPLETVPAQAGGTGWGYAYAGHRYDEVGTPAVTTTVVDDDGGTSAPVATTLDVGGAGQGEALPSRPAAMFAGSTTAADAIRVSGDGNSVTGVVHSNAGITMSGTGHQYVGGTEYATTLVNSGAGIVFDPPAVQRPPVPFPSTHTWADYQPGGRAAISAGANYRPIAASECQAGKWSPKKPLNAGLYVVPCAVQISGKDVAGTITIAAAGDIQVSGSGHQLAPFVDGVVFFSNSTGSRAIDLAGSKQTFAGSILAPSGGIEVTGSQHTLGCGLMGQFVRISGSNNTIAGVECGQSGGGEGTTVSIAAPPLVAPNITATITGNRTDAFPGEEIAYEASLRNGRPTTAEAASTILLMPALVGVDNHDTAPVTVGEVVYTFEVHDPVSLEWTTWASTAADAPSEQRIVTFDGRPSPTPGVVYEDGFDGTVIDPGALGSWASAAQISLSTDQVQALLDPARVDEVRNTVTIETDRTLVRKLTRFDDDPLAVIRTAPASTVADARIVVSRPGGGVATFDQASTPELASLAPGASATVGATSTVAVPEPATPAESDAAYVARLHDADGQRLVASVYGTGIAGVGGVFAAQQLDPTTVHVPVLTATLDAPTQVAPGGEVTATVEITNTGSAEATDLTMTLALVGGGTIFVGGLPASLAPGETATGAATFTTGTTPATYNLAGLVTWSHPGGTPGLYGPLRPTAATETKPSVALDVVKYDDAETVPDGISYVIQATNTGTNPLTAVTLSDPVDANATIVAGSATTTAGTITAGGSAADRTVTVEVGTLEPGASVTVTFAVDYLHAAPGTTEIANQATVTSAELGAILSDDPTRPGTADANVTPITVPSGGGGPNGENNGPIGVVCDPADGATVTAPTAFSCTIAARPDTEVATWNAALIPVGGTAEEAVILGTGTGPTISGDIDPTVLPNGIWSITVTTTDSTGGRSELTSAIVIDGQLKLGRYSVTYQDMAVPVSGIPIQINRTYDTLNRNRQGDFGYGWDLEVANFRVQTNRPLGEGGWQQESCGGGFIIVPLCYRSTRAHFVTVTWPDGRTETFDFTPKALNTFFPVAAIPAYTGRPAATSKLEPVPGDTTAGNRGDGNIYRGGFAEGDIYDATRFVLVAKDGTRYLLDTTTGLVEATDRNGNTITIDDTGVHSSTGSAITWTRDDEGRIDMVTGPDGTDVEYRYDINGDLDRVLDQKDRATTFTYQGDHYLVDTDDPAPGLFRKLGYHPDGRLATITDANNHTTNVSVDVGARTEQVISPDGRLTSISTFDDRGNPVERDDVFADPTGDSHVSAWSYSDDGRDLITSRTDPAGNTWTAGYDEDGNLETFTDAEHHSTAIDYDDYGAPTRIVDANNIESTYTYDSRTGNLTVAVVAGRSQHLDYDSRGNPTRHVDAIGRQQDWTYTTEGFVASRIDGNRQLWRYTNDPMGRVLTELDPGGRQTVHDYDEVGNLLSTTRPMGLVQRWGYDTADRLVSMTDEDNYTTTYGYDDAGNQTRVTDALLHSTTTGYDAQNRPTTSTDALDRTTVTVYDGGGRVASVTDPLLRTTIYGYDRAGRHDRVTAPGRGAVITTFDGNGRTETVSNGEVEITTYVYDAVGRVRFVTDPLQQTTEYRYDAAGNETHVVNPAGETTRSDYDDAGQLTKTTVGITAATPAGVETTEYDYDDNGNPTLVRDGTGRATTTEYDERNLARFVRDNAGHPTEHRYDDAGRRTSTITASGVTTTYGYDRRSNQTSVVDQMGNRSDTAYDPAGRMVTETDGRRYTTTYSYDNANQLTSIRDARGGHVDFDYDAAGQRTTVVDPNGKTRTTGYTPAGDIETQTDALNRTITFGYDLAGRQTSRLDARGLSTVYGYDDAGKLTGELRQEPDSALTAISYGYDGAGRRNSMIDPTGTTTTVYDPAGRITQVASAQGTIDYGYDAAGRRTSMTLPAVAGAAGGTVTYTHDPVGRVQSISEPGHPERATTFDYTLDGRRSVVARPNGVTSTFSHDPAGRATGISYRGPGGELARFNYTLDANGNRTAQRYAYNNGTETVETYTLDELDRLTGVTYSDTGQVDLYQYDPAGNRTNRTRTGGDDPGVVNYHYDDAQQLTSTDGTGVDGGTETYTYDNNGNLAATSSGTQSSYDAENHRTVAADGDIDRFAFNGDGERVGVNGESQLIDSNASLPQLVNDGGGTEYLFHSGSPLLQTNGSEPEYPVVDLLGSVRSTTDAGADLSGTTDFDAFGSVRQGDTPGSLGYAGEPYDDDGTTYLRARQYDPGSGRFLQPDTLQPNAIGSQGWSLYGYASSNPTTSTDPTGHFALVDTSIEEERITLPAQRTLAVPDEVASTLPRIPQVRPPVAPRLVPALVIIVPLLIVADCLQTIAIDDYAGMIARFVPLVGHLCGDEDPCAESRRDCEEMISKAARRIRDDLVRDPAAACEELSEGQRDALREKPFLTRCFFGTLVHEKTAEAVESRLKYHRQGTDFSDIENPECLYELTTNNPGTCAKHERDHPGATIVTYPQIGDKWRFDCSKYWD